MIVYVGNTVSELPSTFGNINTLCTPFGILKFPDSHTQVPRFEYTSSPFGIHTFVPRLACKKME